MQERNGTDKTPFETLIIGVGTEYGDDSFGLLVARFLSQNPPKNTKIVEHSGEGASLIELWKGYNRVIIIDATESGSLLGTIVRYDVVKERIPAHFFRYSTHHFSVAEAIETSRALGILPEKMILFGIEGKQFQPGSSITPELLPFIQQIAQKVKNEIFTLEN